MSISKIFFICAFFISSGLFAQNEIKELTAQKGVSIRAMSVPSEKVIWASGSKGMVAKSTNEGLSFEWMQVKGYEKRDFRALHAWNDQEAIIVAVAAPAIILKTLDGGASWNQVYENSDTSMFLDALNFSDEKHGTVIGDPIDGRLFILTTNNKGSTWDKMPNDFFKSDLKNGEAFFASSNSNLIHLKKALLFVTGGLSSRIWINGMAETMPLMQGTNSTGANSIALSPNRSRVVVVGGDFANDTIASQNIVGYQIYQTRKTNLKKLSTIKLILKKIELSNPNGYKSSVEFIDNNRIITCGTSGVDFSNNKGVSWEKISDASFHIVKKHPSKRGAYLAGGGGRISFVELK
jgi:photosystem II stability/assembly factor-like uncharacterized protein